MSRQLRKPVILPWFFASMASVGGFLVWELAHLGTYPGVRTVSDVPMIVAITMNLAGIPLAVYIAMSAYRSKKPGLASFAALSFVIGCVFAVLPAL